MATAFAVYSSTDQSLSFYKRDSIPEIGSEFEGKLVTKIYTGFEDTEYTTGSASPFYGDRNLIKSITFIDVKSSNLFAILEVVVETFIKSHFRNKIRTE